MPRKAAGQTHVRQRSVSSGAAGKGRPAATRGQAAKRGGRLGAILKKPAVASGRPRNSEGSVSVSKLKGTGGRPAKGKKETSAVASSTAAKCAGKPHKGAKLDEPKLKRIRGRPAKAKKALSTVATSTTARRPGRPKQGAKLERAEPESAPRRRRSKQGASQEETEQESVRHPLQPGKGIKRKGTEQEDAPKDHCAHKHVKLRGGVIPSAAFRLPEGTGIGATRWIQRAPTVKVDARSVGGCLQTAARLARLCYMHAEKGATLEEVRIFKRSIIQEAGPFHGKPVGPPAKATRLARKVKVAKPLELSPLPFAAGEYGVGPAPTAVGVKQLFDLMNARETVAKNREAGLVGASMYEGIPEQYAEYFKRYVCPNVRRRCDRPTRELWRFAAADERFLLCTSDEERFHLKRLLVLNFALWRFVGGTLHFARAVGFLSDWTEREKEWVREVVRKAFHAGQVNQMFSNAYESPNKLRVQLSPKADSAKMQSVLYNTGPKSLVGEPTVTFFTLQGKFAVMDLIWQVSQDVVRAAAPDPLTGKTSWRPATDVLGRIPYFGVSEDGMRVPTFFAKEIIQDLVDTPVFEGGRANVSDLRTFCPAGPGAVLGLCLIFGDVCTRMQRTRQSEAVPMMRAILEAAAGPDGWAHGSAEELELHDIQFQLCELQKFWHRENRFNHLREYLGPRLCSMLEAPIHAEWLDALEEALVLFGDRLGDVVDEQGAIRAAACWLGLDVGEEDGDASCGQGMGRALRHGDGVSFVSRREGSSEPVLLCMKGDLLQAVPESTFPDEAARLRGGAVFIVERLMGDGPVQAQDVVFFRTSLTTHLGPCDEKRVGGLSAPHKCVRYASDRVFRFDVCGATAGPPLGTGIRSGDSVHVCWSGEAGDDRAIEVGAHGRAGCALAPRGTGEGCGQNLTLEIFSQPEKARIHLRHVLREALQSGLLAAGRLLRAEGSGGLRVVS
eukprot:CAMPEP_0203883448 /NCGR_PEP_ID=MMETSP0359-20131031/27552_1 /ASSEMBLY_ACC=CAM_ASM_000338 /TAXON_ID=268821 /ORGANISM="Scrippsiella Hangoei, Strain SHTV-5" /LENGTH=954 /DNA_ID=CAMNT_0050803683 /DNA_START=26 /DNA_END=2886 /DNA_ORIENTATION=+